MRQIIVNNKISYLSFAISMALSSQVYADVNLNDVSDKGSGQFISTGGNVTGNGSSHNDYINVSGSIDSVSLDNVSFSNGLLIGKDINSDSLSTTVNGDITITNGTIINDRTQGEAKYKNALGINNVNVNGNVNISGTTVEIKNFGDKLNGIHAISFSASTKENQSFNNHSITINNGANIKSEGKYLSSSALYIANFKGIDQINLGDSTSGKRSSFITEGYNAIWISDAEIQNINIKNSDISSSYNGISILSSTIGSGDGKAAISISDKTSIKSSIGISLGDQIVMQPNEITIKGDIVVDNSTISSTSDRSSELFQSIRNYGQRIEGNIDIKNGSSLVGHIVNTGGTITGAIKIDNSSLDGSIYNYQSSANGQKVEGNIENGISITNKSTVTGLIENVSNIKNGITVDNSKVEQGISNSIGGSIDNINISNNSTIGLITNNGSITGKVSIKNSTLTSSGYLSFSNNANIDQGVDIQSSTVEGTIYNYGTIKNSLQIVDTKVNANIENGTAGVIDNLIVKNLSSDSSSNKISNSGQIDKLSLENVTLNGGISNNGKISNIDFLDDKSQIKGLTNSGQIGAFNLGANTLSSDIQNFSDATIDSISADGALFNANVLNAGIISGSVNLQNIKSDNKTFRFFNSGKVNTDKKEENAFFISKASYDSFSFENKGTIENNVVIGDKNNLTADYVHSDLAVDNPDRNPNVTDHTISITNLGTITGNIEVNSSNAEIIADNQGYVGQWTGTDIKNGTGNFIINGNNNNVTITNQEQAFANSTIVGGSENNFTILNYNPALANKSTKENPNITIKKGALSNNFYFEHITFNDLKTNNPQSSIIIKDENLDSSVAYANTNNTYTVKNVEITQVDLNSFSLQKNIDFRDVIKIVDNAGDDAQGSAGNIIPMSVNVSKLEQSLGLKGQYYTSGENAGIYVISVAPENNTGGIIMQSLGNILFHRSQYIDNIINNNTIQSVIHRYRDGNNWHLFVNPYYTKSSSDLLGGSSTDYNSSGAIIGAHRGIGRGVVGLFAGYEQTNADSNKILPISMDMDSIYGGIKYSGLITKFGADSFLYGRTLAKIASNKIDVTRSAEINSQADIYNLSWTISGGIGYGYVNKNTNSIFLLDVGPGYNGSSTKNFRLKGYADEFYHANMFNMITADISARWLQDWTKEFKTVVDIGYKHGFNTDISGFGRIRGTKVEASFDLPSSYYYGIASVVYHTKAVDYQLGYSTMFDKNSRDNSIFAQISVAF